jgi:hypothetical protein
MNRTLLSALLLLAVSAVAAALLLGTRSVGECVEETVIWESRSAQPLEILETAIESDSNLLSRAFGQ